MKESEKIKLMKCFFRYYREVELPHLKRMAAVEDKFIAKLRKAGLLENT